MADSQAKGNTSRSGGIAAGGSGSRVERSTGEPPTAIAIAVVPDQVVDKEEELDAAATQDDGEGRPVSCDAGICGCGGPGISWFGRIRNPRQGASTCLAGSAAGGQHQ